MRLVRNAAWLSSAMLLFCLSLMAQESRVACPDTVSLSDPQLAKPVEGWTMFVDTGPHRLSRVAFFDGPVEQHATLAPDRDRSVGKTRTAVWHLQPKPEHKYWLACYYSRTSLALSQALPEGLKECTVTYSVSVSIDGMPAIKSLKCR